MEIQLPQNHELDIFKEFQSNFIGSHYPSDYEDKKNKKIEKPKKKSSRLKDENSKIESYLKS